MRSKFLNEMNKYFSPAHTFEGFPLRQVDAPLFTQSVLDIPLLTPAQTPVTSTPGPSSFMSALPIAYFAPSPALPINATPVAEQSPVVMVRKY